MGQKGLSESTQKTITLLKSTFKLEAFSAMEGKMFDIWLILEFSGAATDMPIVEWIENVELVCELCPMKNVERVLPLACKSGKRVALSDGNEEVKFWKSPTD